jgi:hypothetical protein
VTFDKNEVGDNWPLIRYLLDDPVYRERYVGFIDEAVSGSFEPKALEQECRRMAALISPYASAESGDAAFQSAVQALIARIYERNKAAAAFVAGEGA